MDEGRNRLFARLADLGIATTTVAYPAHRTVEEGKARRGSMPGQFTKNLLLRDKKGALFLIVACEDRNIDLKTLHKSIGAQGRLGFAAPEMLHTALGCEPGSLTPFAVINDREGQVDVILDAGLMGAERLNFHPLVNTECTSIAPRDLIAFLDACGRHFRLLDFPEMVGEDATLR